MYMRKKDWDVDDIVRQLRSIQRQVNNPYNDGFTAAGCKQDLYQIKCLLDDLYADTPSFTVEKEWEQERILNMLKKL